ncbi:flavoprotein [Catenulispora sp. NF23]|uniref:Flavoprotein n=1 Tax=Catenulispora pinistramenti TaxID=2705254 RepID=A0ABS5KXP0_9ACTN|nr:flavoprotein [Catenulispora pinistramenti]MBS2534256.1 flavoprotein [Catenulispora pinistramenti]MBS2550816.1 flavoprotein [Catenulispora pinistramenti]
MTNAETPRRPVLYLVACAAPPVLDIADPIKQAQDRAWDVCLILTPTAALWLEDSLEELATLTGHPVRQRYKLPGQPDVLPAADAVLVAPATFNVINKWAAGSADTLALGLITEGIGKGLPLVALPHLNSWQAAHSAFPRSVEQLRADGVRVLIEEADGNTPHVPGAPGPRPPFPWRLGLDALNASVTE